MVVVQQNIMLAVLTVLGNTEVNRMNFLLPSVFFSTATNDENMISSNNNNNSTLLIVTLINVAIAILLLVNSSNGNGANSENMLYGRSGHVINYLPTNGESVLFSVLLILALHTNNSSSTGNNN